MKHSQRCLAPEAQNCRQPAASVDDIHEFTGNTWKINTGEETPGKQFSPGSPFVNPPVSQLLGNPLPPVKGCCTAHGRPRESWLGVN